MGWLGAELGLNTVAGEAQTMSENVWAGEQPYCPTVSAAGQLQCLSTVELHTDASHLVEHQRRGSGCGEIIGW
jgi:hypothetical protein